jgi:hypothetical protein
MVVPGLEPAGPSPRRVHPADHDLLAATPHDVDGTVYQHPPVVRVFSLVPQVDARLHFDLGAAPHELAQLLVGQPVEEADRAEVLDAHQIVAR